MDSIFFLLWDYENVVSPFLLGSFVSRAKKEKVCWTPFALSRSKVLQLAEFQAFFAMFKAFLVGTYFLFK